MVKAGSKTTEFGFRMIPVKKETKYYLYLYKQASESWDDLIVKMIEEISKLEYNNTEKENTEEEINENNENV